jgi:Type II secretion system (T2SS), protein E, N-terminal domain
VAKTLIEIVVDAGLATKPAAMRVAKSAQAQTSPLVVALIRELTINEADLANAIAKGLRLPLLTSASVSIDPDVIREVPAAIAKRLYAVPLSLRSDQRSVLRVAMADPSDMVAIAELEQASGHELELCVMPSSMVEELLQKLYVGFSTAVVQRSATRPQQFVDNVFVTSRKKKKSAATAAMTDDGQEISVTAQVPMPHRAVSANTGDRDESVSQIQARLQESAGSWRDLEARFRALYAVLVAKGLVTPDEVAAAMFELAQKGE